MTTTTPNMGLTVPTPGVTPGSTTWANLIVGDYSIIDSHNHSTGQGVPINPDGLDINAALPMGNNPLTSLGYAQFFAQPTLLTTLAALYSSGVDLYYTDGAGNQIRITQSGSVTGSSGTITGLPSGTASASYSAGTFTFQSATNTPATMNVGPIVTGAAAANSKNVTLSASGILAADYAMTYPLALPGSTSFFNCDASGNQGFVASTGSGSVVLASSPSISSPTFSGTPSGTITGTTYTPTITLGPAGSSAAIIANSFSYVRVNDRVTVFGGVSGITSGSGFFSAYISLPINPTSNFGSSVNVMGTVGMINISGGTLTQNYVSAVAGAKQASANILVANAATTVQLSVTFTYSCA